MRFLRRSLTGLFMLALAAALLAWAGQMVGGAIEARLSREAPERPARERVVAVNVLPLTPETLTPTLTAFGEVRASRRLELRARAAGTVVALHPAFVEGGQVAAGDLLVQVDPASARAARERARADLADAEAEARDAARGRDLAGAELQAAERQARLRAQALARQQGLRDRGVGTDAAVETAELAAAAADQAVLSRRQALAQAETRLDTAQTRIARARIGLSEAERELADTALHAAFDGTLSGVSLVEGGRVSVGEQLAELIDPGALEVSFRVSVAQYAHLLGADGQLGAAPITATLDSAGVPLTARGAVIRESGAVTSGETGRVLFATLDQARGFRPGDFVTVTLEEQPLERVARLPATAVDAAPSVLVLGADDRLERAEITLLRRQGDSVIVRAPGLAGREVVAERSPLLGAGIKVRPIRPGGAGTPDAPEMVALGPDLRAELVALVEASARPPEAKARILEQLQADQVPAQMVERIRAQAGG